MPLGNALLTLLRLFVSVFVENGGASTVRAKSLYSTPNLNTCNICSVKEPADFANEKSENLALSIEQQSAQLTLRRLLTLTLKISLCTNGPQTVYWTK